MKQKSNYRCKRIIFGLLGVFLALGMTVLFSGGTADAASDSVKTGKNGWTWEYWTSPEDENSIAFGRCKNTATGEYLSGGWFTVDGCRYFFTKQGYARDEFHDGCLIGNCRTGGEYEEGKDPVLYFWEKDKNGWRYVTNTVVPASEETGEEEQIVKGYLSSCSAWIDAKIYLFDENGYLPKKGWYQGEGGAWYYIYPAGHCATGWKKIGSKWFFFDYATGKMAEAGGRDTRKPFAEKEEDYIFTKNGSMRDHPGWVQDNEGNWFYAKKSGRPVYGWKTVKGVDYYFEEALRGQMAASVDVEWYQDGFYLNDYGVKEETSYAWIIGDDDTRCFGFEDDLISDSVVYIDGWMYTFDQNGYCKYGVNLEDGTRVTYHVKGNDYTYDDLYLVAAVIYCEAGGEPYEGQLAVGNVVMNHLRSGYFGNTVEEVVYHRNSFSVVNSQKFKKCLETGGSETALRAAKEALEGTNNNVEGCLRFRTAKSVDPDDSTYIIIGNIAFY